MTKQFLVLFIVSYVIYYYDTPKKIFNNILKRHGLDKLIKNIKKFYKDYEKKMLAYSKKKMKDVKKIVHK